MAFLTLLLSAMPCCVPEEHRAEAIHQASQAPEQSGEDCPESEGPCSPFYACGTCPGCVETAELTWGEIPAMVPKICISDFYLDSYSNILPLRLLRPPISEFSQTFFN